MISSTHIRLYSVQLREDSAISCDDNARIKAQKMTVVTPRENKNKRKKE